MTVVLFSWLAATASAEPLETTIGLSVNAIIGQHEVGRGQSDRLSFAPLPLVETTFRSGGESVRLEGLPPFTVGYFNQSNGGASTRLSILNGTYRHAVRGGWFAGIGQTVYNQNTEYPPRNNLYVIRSNTFEAVNGSLREYSRVTGLRLETGRSTQLGPLSTEFFAAFNPRMHGITYTRVPTFKLACPPGAVSFASCSQVIDTFADGESGTQIDLSARFARRVSKHGQVVIGVRYINYTAHYDDNPGQLADRNVGFAPTLGYRLTF